jgi:dUTP pyrophosphatase
MAQESLNVQLFLLPDNEDIGLPKYATPEAAAMDVSAAIQAPVCIPPGATVVVPCGFQISVPTGYAAQILPRSGIATRNNVTVANSPGIIDPDYRGEVSVALVNNGSTDFHVKRGARIAQIMLVPAPRIQWMKVFELTATDRGDGGFGHTGS